jgi:hypothetical protein
VAGGAGGEGGDPGRDQQGRIAQAVLVEAAPVARRLQGGMSGMPSGTTHAFLHHKGVGDIAFLLVQPLGQVNRP